ncbi:hypothetical protein [Pseudoalteromonas luteoviolacea]|uniref:Uncharacterized protein n=1 Tax=Pseudoalteromonas luteoviolacea NCIMB 1942 TaxID=1365253 RepID=A0A167BWG3_9GAMM|nr:hypothetical protein [Pseudoalteromonas luteoviolacea]KZN46978.1 hypothetical protein N482_11230 [Pseudoalteromonas luteoviolacea NCIMB 1942]
MSRAKRRIRWRRVRILKPYNYYFHVGAKPQTNQLVSQPLKGTHLDEIADEQLSSPADTPSAKSDKFAIFDCESQTIDVNEESQPTMRHKDASAEALNVADADSPVAEFEPGKNPYIFYLQQVPMMLTGLPQEVAVPASTDTQVVSEPEPHHSTEADIDTSISAAQPQYEAASAKSDDYPLPKKTDNEAHCGDGELLFWENPSAAYPKPCTHRQGVKSPHAANLLVRFGGHADKSVDQRGFIVALDRQLQKQSLKLNTWATLWHSPKTLARWASRQPLEHLLRLLKGQYGTSVSTISTEQFLFGCICHGGESLINEAQLAECVLPVMEVINHFQFEGRPEAFIDTLSAQYSTSYWVLIRQMTNPILCARLSSLVMSAPWSGVSHIVSSIDWRKPVEVTLFAIPSGAGTHLATQYVRMKSRWQPYLTMPLLEFMFLQQSLPDSPNYSGDILHRIDAST